MHAQLSNEEKINISAAIGKSSTSKQTLRLCNQQQLVLWKTVSSRDNITSLNGYQSVHNILSNSYFCCIFAFVFIKFVLDKRLLSLQMDIPQVLQSPPIGTEGESHNSA